MGLFRRYGFLGLFHLLKSFLYTKIFFSNARIIRLPFDIRNRRNIKIGKKFTTGPGCRIEAYPLDDSKKICITIGNNVQINDYVHIGAVGSITIGNNVLMASKIYISDHNHGSYDANASDSPLSLPMERQRIIRPVVIEDNVWIGESVCILPGVTVGTGCVIGALSVVTKDIPPYSIAVGNPARVVKTYNFNNQIWEIKK
jgi:lipopolysaccharide O-acetyltransferase